MKIDARSSLADVAVVVGDALRRAGIRAVLTGGACANLYTGGAYQSMDADFTVAIALRNRVALSKIREWSRREGHVEGFQTFLAEVERLRKSRRRVGRSSR